MTITQEVIVIKAIDTASPALARATIALRRLALCRSFAKWLSQSMAHRLANWCPEQWLPKAGAMQHLDGIPSWAKGTPKTSPHYPYEGPAQGWVEA